MIASKFQQEVIKTMDDAMWDNAELSKRLKLHSGIIENILLEEDTPTSLLEKQIGGLLHAIAAISSYHGLTLDNSMERILEYHKRRIALAQLTKEAMSYVD
jgi:hypothetical protein